ncbi:bacteriocin immunity protein [uncultured Gimesia sp.]|uniref:bacteriocin immunity protein n=1 Tax=uncultured Gimesia sp. TaxID=1678688 RepID=UPI0030DB61F3|tara:strand:+ start:39256 stop:39678 length:423 start_codon:yes stop_codon:yes gene_type:complete
MADRDRLIELVEQLSDEIEQNGNRDLLIEEFDTLVPDTGQYLEDFCGSNYPSELIVDLCLGMTEAQQPLTRKELLALVKRILTEPAESEAKSILRVIAFQYNCSHPGGSDLLFYPDNIFGTSEPTAEMIVDKAISENMEK